jgi:hypothetical protein
MNTLSVIRCSGGLGGAELMLVAIGHIGKPPVPATERLAARLRRLVSAYPRPLGGESTRELTCSKPALQGKLRIHSAPSKVATLPYDRYRCRTGIEKIVVANTMASPKFTPNVSRTSGSQYWPGDHVVMKAEASLEMSAESSGTM